MMKVLYRLALLGVLACSRDVGVGTRAGLMPVGDGALNYEASGNGPALVFINGWALNLRTWDDQVAAFSPTHRVIRYDLRGFGKSTGHADRSRDADDLRILLDSLGVVSARVVGLSRGGSIAADFAARWPERVDALVLYGAGPTPDFPMPPEARGGPPFADIARQHGLDSLMRFLAASPVAWVPPDRPEATDRIGRAMEGYDGRDLLDPRPESGRVPFATIDALSGLRVRTLIVHGDHEMPLLQAVADTLSKVIPGAQLTVIRNGGHGAHFAQPEEFNSVLRRFLQPR